MPHFLPNSEIEHVGAGFSPRVRPEGRTHMRMETVCILDNSYAATGVSLGWVNPSCLYWAGIFDFAGMDAIISKEVGSKIASFRPLPPESPIPMDPFAHRIPYG
jgi:hypothetical protein